MIADENMVRKLIPQGDPMVMVSELISSDDLCTVSTLLIKEDNIFCSDGFFKEPGIVENIAQTAALRSGYHAFVNKEKPKVGFIGSVKKLMIYDLPKVNDYLETKVEVVSELFNAIIIKGEVKVGDKLIAKGNMNIFLQ